MRKGVDIGRVTPEEAIINISKTFSDTSQPQTAQSKLMQVTWLYNLLTLTDKNRNKFLTDMIYLIEKAGRRFRPLRKIVLMKQNIPIEDLIDSFDSDEKNLGKRYREFLYHCFLKFEKQIKKIKSKKIINKYITMRNNTFSYLIQNEKEITLKLSRSK